MHACMKSSEEDTFPYASFAVLRGSNTNNTAVKGVASLQCSRAKAEANLTELPSLP